MDGLLGEMIPVWSILLLINTLHNADCQTGIKDIETDSVDLILTDPPYGSTSLKLDKGADEFDWASFSMDLQRVLKPNGWFFMFTNVSLGVKVYPHWQFRFDYICVKTAPVYQHGKVVKPRTQHELLWAFCQPELTKMHDLYMDKKALETWGLPYMNIQHIKSQSEFSKQCKIVKVGAAKTNTGYREGTTLLTFTPKAHQHKGQRTPHPTQKPLNICKTIVNAYCPPEGMVLDPFAGSGTTLHAAKIANRNAVGFELNPTYYKMASDRLASTL